MGKSEQAEFTNMIMLTREDGKMLFQRRVDPDWGGLVFPGGHVEAGESFYHAAVREMREETGLTVERPRLCGIKQFESKSGARYVVLLYKAAQFTGELQSSSEGEVLWLTAEEAAAEGFADGFEEMLQLFLDDSLDELTYTKENDQWQHNFY
ncbi:MAG: NUDIX domain-containing protein [Oscillospiraceae bacterium]|nr:NUDIX domain-containing protein [Oscillospiraceae bacterium]